MSNEIIVNDFNQLICVCSTYTLPPPPVAEGE